MMVKSLCLKTRDLSEFEALASNFHQAIDRSFVDFNYVGRGRNCLTHLLPRIILSFDVHLKRCGYIYSHIYVYYSFYINKYKLFFTLKHILKAL